MDYPSDKAYENTSLLRTEADSSTAQSAQHDEESTLGHKQGSDLVTGSAFPFTLSTDSSTVVCAERVVSSSRDTPIPPVAENVVYDEIKRFKTVQESNVTSIAASSPSLSRTEVDVSPNVVYAETVVSRSGNIPIPPATENVVYDEIKGLKNKQVCTVHCPC